MAHPNESIQLPDDRIPKDGLRRNVMNRTPRLPERGRVKIGFKGEKRQGRNGIYQIPQKTDYFTVTTMERDEKTDNFVRDDEMHKRLGDRPVSIPIRLLFNDPALNFRSGYAVYTGKKAWCRGDGVEAKRLRAANANPNDFVWVSCPCFRVEQGYEGDDKCKIGGDLQFIIDNAPGIGGVYRFITTSFNCVDSIQATLALLHQATGGQIANIPLSLVLRPKTVTLPKGGSTEIQVVAVEYAGTTENLLGHALEAARLTAGHAVRMERLEHLEREATKNEPIIPADDIEEFNPPQPDGEDCTCKDLPAGSEHLDGCPAKKPPRAVSAEVDSSNGAPPPKIVSPSAPKAEENKSAPTGEAAKMTAPTLDLKPPPTAGKRGGKTKGETATASPPAEPAQAAPTAPVASQATPRKPAPLSDDDSPF